LGDILRGGLLLLGGLLRVFLRILGGGLLPLGVELFAQALHPAGDLPELGVSAVEVLGEELVLLLRQEGPASGVQGEAFFGAGVVLAQELVFDLGDRLLLGVGGALLL